MSESKNQAAPSDDKEPRSPVAERESRADRRFLNGEFAVGAAAVVAVVFGNWSGGGNYSAVFGQLEDPFITLAVFIIIYLFADYRTVNVLVGRFRFTFMLLEGMAIGSMFFALFLAWIGSMMVFVVLALYSMIYMVGYELLLLIDRYRPDFIKNIANFTYGHELISNRRFTRKQEHLWSMLLGANMILIVFIVRSWLMTSLVDTTIAFGGIALIKVMRYIVLRIAAIQDERPSVNSA